jgi:hypothetical protein
MELLSVFKADNQRLFVTQIFPGALAFWPFAAMILDGLGVYVNISFEWESAIIIFVYLLVSAGVGLLVEDVGSLFELKLEGIYHRIKTLKRGNEKDNQDPILSWEMILSLFRHLFAFPLILIPFNSTREWLLGNHIKQRRTNKSQKDIEKRFYGRWSRYLSINIPKDNEPVILRYYRSVLVRFKFELNTSAALMAMLIGHFIMVIRSLGFSGIWDRVNIYDTILYVSLVIFVISILLMEAFKGIELLDDLRKKAIKICADRSLS